MRGEMFLHISRPTYSPPIQNTPTKIVVEESVEYSYCYPPPHREVCDLYMHISIDGHTP